MKPLNLLLFFFCTGTFQSFAQIPIIQWQNTIGGSLNDYGRMIRQTSDNGYILGGYSSSDISGDKTENSINSTTDYWVLKLNSAGAIVWQNTIGGNGTDELWDLQQTVDGGYIIGGFSSSGISGDKTENSQGSYDYWVVKLDASGNIQWQNTIGGNDYDELRAIRQTSDGGYILGGYSASGISGDKTENPQGLFDYWVVKLDASGNIQWENTIGGSGWDVANAIQETADGGYIIGGTSSSDISGDKTENSLGGDDYWVLKLNSAGSIVWQNTIGGSSHDGLRSIQQTTDGGYILSGESSSPISGDKTENGFGDDYWVVKLDATGNVLWENTIIGDNTDYAPYTRQTSDGGFIVAGWSRSGIWGDKSENSRGWDDFWVLKLNSAGAIQWQKTIGGAGFEFALAVHQTSDNGFIIGGYSDSDISGEKTENSQGSGDYWVVKLSPNCPSISFSLSQTPTPCAGKVKISSTAATGGVAPYLYKLNNGTYGTSRNWSVNQSGTYTVTVKDANNCETSQMIMVTVIPKLNATVIKTKPSCFGGSDGTGAAVPTGGTPPYTYEWKQGATVIGTDSTITTLSAGSYTLKVTDAANCMKTVNFSITQPNLLVLSLYSIVPNGSNYDVKLAATGGTGTKMYQRCDDAIGTNCTAFQTSTLFKNTPMGTYVFIVKDSKNCTDSLTQNVPGPSPFERRQPPVVTGSEGLISLSPNPFSDLVTLSKTGEFSASFAVKVYDVTGSLLAEYIWDADAESLDLLTGHLSNGSFFLKVFAEDGSVQQVLKGVKTE